MMMMINENRMSCFVLLLPFFLLLNMKTEKREKARDADIDKMKKKELST